MDDRYLNVAARMAEYIRTYSYDDFPYLSIVLDCIQSNKSLRDVSYLDTSLVTKYLGGDCTQLSNHFAKTVLEPLTLEWKWLVSTDDKYRSSYKHRLIPFRSTAIKVEVPGAGEHDSFYCGVALGHQRPIRIADGVSDNFWGKSYSIEVLSETTFRLHTKGKRINRYREYLQPLFIDFESAWENMVYVKDTYSIVAYHTGVRHYLGYNLPQNRVYYTLRSARLRSKPLAAFLLEAEKHYEQFVAQIRSEHALETIRRLIRQRDALNRFVIQRTSEQIP